MTGFVQLSFILKILLKMIIQFVLGVTCDTMFLVDSVGTFIEYQPDYYKSSWRYCDYNLYMFAFYCYIGEYLVLAIVTLYVCIMFAFYIVDEKPNPYPKDTRRLGIIVLIVCIIIPVVKIIIGITHRNYCDTNRHIPALLYMTGFVQLSFVVTFIVKILSKMIIQFILGVTCVTMFLVGSVGTSTEY
nr:unnamed protein product [Callosobruchus analis]